MKRILVPNKDGRYLRQSLEQAVDLAADLIAASECHHPIPPPSQSSSRGTERERPVPVTITGQGVTAAAL